MNNVEYLEDAVHQMADAIRKLRESTNPSDRQACASEVIETAEELNKSITHVVPEIERQAVQDAQMDTETAGS